VAHAVLIVVGLVLLLYPLTVGASPDISCRGVVMRPGDTCAKADNSGTQSYEQRAATARQARPVVFGLGLLVTAFGTSLLVTDLRRRRR
jgi:hypothetical protein